MRIILTHEQADFDALAGLLGVSLLQDGDIPILPNRTNRNVRNYLTLFREELPFTELRDLPAESIELITLVDTQSLVTIKGITSHTKVHVIDHHQAKTGIDPLWQLNIQQTGAVTTILVESLQKADISVSPIHATLLLLGIYEDTGALTYASTTARDIRAAAYLMESGANLKIVTTYLNPPLSPDQRLLYEKLISAAKTLNINGQRIVISSAEAIGLNEEISSIAHKLRDLLEPHGLIILVATDEGYRMVLRSTTDQVNVAALASHFGGGGHERASAALIHRNYDETEQSTIRLPSILAELEEILPKFIKPSLTVAQMMSRRPRLISPEITAQEASLLMQRYGYEGFPVVRDHKVVGLLTRRAVDRAITHKLNLKASSLMESGSVTVHISESLENVQKLMMETGWGQIPVVDEQNSEIIGIITRTDILKSISKSSAPHHQRSLAQQLKAALPVAQIKLLQIIAEMALKNNSMTYVVGGFVRDLILKRPVSDYDLVIEGDAISLAKLVTERYGGRLVTHSRFGTAKWYISNQVKDEICKDIPELESTDSALPMSLDFISARTEFYERPTALPVVERSGIKLDLHRRDFTINTLAIRLDPRHFGELIDSWGGYADIQHKVIRVLHSLSFIDDPTRILRAVRFEHRFSFNIDKRTLELMSEAADQLKAITGERLRHELDLIFAEEDPAGILNRLQELNLLVNIHPALTWDVQKSDALSHLLNTSLPKFWDIPEKVWSIPAKRIMAYACWLCDLSKPHITQLGSRLRLPGQMIKVIEQTHDLNTEVEKLIGQKPSKIVTALDPYSILSLAVIRFMNLQPEVESLLDDYQSTWKRIKASIDGDEMIRLGYPPGPDFRSLLTDLRNAIIDQEITSGLQEYDYLKNKTKLNH